MKLDTWAERDIPGTGRWCNRQASRASVRDLRRLREVVVAVRLAFLVGRSDWCVNSERRVWCIERANGG